MKNVEKSSMHGSLEKICHGLAKEITVFTVGAACCLAPLGARADGITQLQYLQTIAQLSGATGQFKGNAGAADYVNWAKSVGISPSAGWEPGATLKKNALAQTLVQLLNINPNKFNGDLNRILAREGIDLSKVGDDVSKDDLTSLIDQGLAVRTFVSPKGPQSAPPNPAHSGRPGKTTLLCQNGHTISVSTAAVDAHIRNGATTGPCHGTPVSNP